MSLFTEYFISEQLRQMGWPKSKGVFRKEYYVETSLFDMVVEQAIQICVGLGAGRPKLGAAVLVNLFSDNPWTKESTTDLLKSLKQECEGAIKRNAALLPWEAIYVGHKIESYGREIAWQALGDPRMRLIRMPACGVGVFWGLIHPELMPDVFAKVKKSYEESARVFVPHGLDVPLKFPWTSLDDFYDSGEDILSEFEAARVPIDQVPPSLLSAPEISHRFK